MLIVHFLQSEARDPTERRRFDQVCEELERALRREEEAQQLLNEQNMRIQQLSLRYALAQ